MVRSLVVYSASTDPDGRRHLGVLDGEYVQPSRLVPEDLPETLAEWGSGGQLPIAGDPLHSSQVELLPPLAPGSRVFCVAQNYPAHAAEAGGPSPATPIVFLKPHSSFVGHDQVASIAPVTTAFDYEGEIAVVIGREVTREPTDTVASAVAGYTIANDGSARDLQPATLAGRLQIDWFAAKCIEEGSAMGPGIVPASEVPSPEELRIVTTHNREQVQDDVVGSMTHPIADLISFLSDILTLRSGDIVLTGTPAGVGKSRGVYLADGDVVSVAVSGLGELTTRYVAR